MQEMTPTCCEQLTQQNIPNYMVVFMQGNGDVDHFFSLTATFGERWILKDSALESPLMISKFMAFHLTKFMSDKDNTKFYVYTLSGNAPYDQKPTSVTLEYLKNYKKGKSHLSNYCWLNKDQLDDSQVAFIYFGTDKLEDLKDVDDGYYGMVVDSFRYHPLSDDVKAYNSEKFKYDDDDNLIDDRLDSTDIFNRQTASSACTMLNYILHPYTECTPDRIYKTKPTHHKTLVERYGWDKSDVEGKFGFGCFQDNTRHLVTIGRFDAYLREIAGSNYVRFEKLP